MAREIIRGAVHRLGRLHHIEKGLEVGMNLPTAFTYATQHLGEVQVTHDSEDTAEAIRTRPVLLVANHPAAAPLALLPALTDRLRNDVHIMADATLVDYFGPLAKDHLIPTFKPGPTLRRVVSPGTILKAIEGTSVAPEEARRRNRGALEKGIDVITQGGMFVILPTGGDGTEWRAGIGKLVKELLIRGVDFDVVSAYIADTRQADNARLVAPRLFRKILGRFEPTVHFNSDLQQFTASNADRLKHMSPRAIARELQSIYEQYTAIGILEPLFA